MLLILAFPPYHLPVVAVLALVPLAYAVENARDSSIAMVAGMAWGAAFFGVELHWIPAVLSDETPLGWLAFFGVVGILCLLGGMVGVASRRMADRGIAPALAFAVAFAGVEWIRAHFGPLAFPWLGVGTAWGSTPTAMAPAAWVGERGLTFATAALSGLVAAVLGGWAPRWRDTKSRSHWAPLLWAGGLAAIWATISAVPSVRDPASRETGQEVALAVVTTAFGARAQVDVEDRILWIEAVLDRWKESAPDEVSAVLLPEGALPTQFEQRPDLVRRVADLSERVGAPLLIGAYGASDGATFNSTFLVGSEGILERSDKRHRVPIIESGFGSGSPVALRTEVASFGPIVCFESLHSGVARDLVRAGATVLVNPTSESWFTPGAPWAAAQHGEHLRSRALETRRPVVRVANDGESLVVSGDGRVTWRSTSPGVARVVVRPGAGRTLYVRTGDALGLLCGSLALLLLLVPATLRQAVHR